jgi:hypothetical protein
LRTSGCHHLHPNSFHLLFNLSGHDFLYPKGNFQHLTHKIQVRDDLGLRIELNVTMASFFLGYALIMIQLVTESREMALVIGSSVYMIAFAIIAQTALVLIPALKTFKSLPNLEKTPESFKMVLNNPILRVKFQDVLLRDFCTENLIFYDLVETIKQKENFLKLADLEARFLSPGGQNELNLPSKIIRQARAELHDNDMNPIEVLERLQTMVFQMMYENNYGKFLMETKDTEAV